MFAFWPILFMHFFRIGPVVDSVNGVTVTGFVYRYLCFVQAVHIVLSQVMFNQEYVNAFVTYMHTRCYRLVFFGIT